MKGSFNIQLKGYPSANRDATVRLVHEATGRKTERKPFLDGKLLVRDMEPGFYEMEVRHPNLIHPIDRRRIRLFPQPFPTLVPVPIEPSLFRDSPIRDIPDADLGPVQQSAVDVRDRLSPIAAKAAGEVIRAADWNALVGAVQDLAGSVLELSGLVAPQGHDHPEIAEKISEVQGNVRRFIDSFGKSLLELRREVETADLSRSADDVMDAAGASQGIRDRVKGRIAELEENIHLDSATFTRKLTTTGDLILTAINEMADSQGDNVDVFLAKEEVTNLKAVASEISSSGTQIKAEEEIKTYMRSTKAAGGKKLGRMLRR